MLSDINYLTPVLFFTSVNVKIENIRLTENVHFTPQANRSRGNITFSVNVKYI